MRFPPFMSHYSPLKRPIDFTEKFFRNNTVRISQKNKTEGEVRSTNNKSTHAILELQTALKPSYNRPFSTFDMNTFEKLCRHHWERRPRISKTAKFDSDLLKTIKDKAFQSHKHFPHHTNGCKFSQLCGAIPSLA